MSTNPVETSAIPSTDTLPIALRDTAEDLARIGLSWARYGLTVGRFWLQTSSRVLGAVSETLEDVGTRLGEAR